MGRVIKAPNVRDDRPYPVVEREKVIRMAQDDAESIVQGAQEERDFMIRQCEEEIQSLVEQAQQEAEALKQQAKAEGEKFKEAARQQGQAQGLQQGQEEARRQVAGLLDEFRALMAEGQRLLEGIFVDQEPEIRRIVSEIAGRVIQTKVEEDDEIVVRVAQECIRKAADRKHIRILVNPDDQQKIEEWAPHFSRLFDDINKVTVEADPRVGRGGVMIESGAGGVDGRLDKQVGILNDVLLNP